MMNWFKRLFFKEWKAIGTIQYFYSKENGEPLVVFSAIFSMSPDGDRKVDIDSGIVSRLFPAKNHPFYHNFCVPYLNKTGDFEADDHAIIMVQTLEDAAISPEALYISELAATTAVKQRKERMKSVDNVVPFSPKPKD